MGWERKRGKLEEFNRLLRGATDTSFDVAGRASSASCPACATASRSTPTPACRATPRRKLVGDHRAPAQPPALRPGAAAASPRATAILQPRVSVTMASAAGSLFARIYAGHTGVDPYTTAVSDTYQDLFGEGIFTGKGLYDVDAFAAALDGRVPENALLSHDLFEGLHARTGARHRRRGGRRLPVERPRPRPAPAPLGARRLADPGLALPLRAHPRRAARATGCPLIARWKILDNLRRSLVAAGDASLLLLAGWTRPAGKPGRLDRGRPRRRSRSRSSRWRSRRLAGPAAQQPWRAFLRGASRRTPGRRWRACVLQLAFLANQAYADGARHRRHAGPARHHPAPAARVGDRGRERGAGAGRAEGPAAAVPGRDGGEPAIAAGGPRCSSRRSVPARSSSAAPVLAAVGCRAARSRTG